MTGAAVRHPVTLVTSFFLIGNRSKRGEDFYMKWKDNFIPSVRTPLAIFTSHETNTQMISWRNGLPGCSIPLRLDDIPRIKKHILLYTQQNALDPEASIHSEELYKIWNSKPWMVMTIARWNPFASEYFFWVDSGSFRESNKFSSWPDISKVNSMFAKHADSMLLGLIACLAQDKSTDVSGPIPGDMIEGTFFGGAVEGITWWSREFYRLHDTYIAQGKFVGKDQNLMNSVALLNQDKVMVIETSRQSCYNQWFFFQPFLASATEMVPACENDTNMAVKSISECCS